MTSAQRRGFAVDADLIQKQIEFSLKTFRNKTLIAKGQGVGGDSTGVVYALHTFAAAERAYDETTAALVGYLLVKQRKDGSWPIAGPTRSPAPVRYAEGDLALRVARSGLIDRCKLILENDFGVTDRSAQEFSFQRPNLVNLTHRVSSAYRPTPATYPFVSDENGAGCRMVVERSCPL